MAALASETKVLIDVISDIVFCWIGKRNLETALRSSGVDAVVRWKAYQLNPSASDTPSSKVEMYMRKFGRSREEVLQLSRSMEQKFAAVGLPHSFTEKALVSNTLDGHRVLAWAGAQSPAAQDAAAERLFRGYFAEERAPNDAAVLVEACVEAGKSEADARAFVADKGAFRREVEDELRDARTEPQARCTSSSRSPARPRGDQRRAAARGLRTGAPLSGFRAGRAP
ncbi:DSBA-like thioredoxin domain containing protein [Aureococcus anophagefferens]|nr:DSBA-like thioredoxin domain containing protein [Aureococcus anophagefferens]